MAKKPGTNPKGEFAFFNVVYEDNSQRSNRRVPSELLGGLDGDEPARGYIMEQDREIAAKSGRTPLAISRASAGSGQKRESRLRGSRAFESNGSTHQRPFRLFQANSRSAKPSHETTA